MLSKRILKTVDQGQEWYYHTLTGEKLSITEDESILKKHLFLEGQDYEAIVSTLMKDRGIFSLTIIPTWECNLRCTHCSVTTMLKKTDDGELNTNNLINFIKKYLDKYNPTHVAMHFVGGEPLLKSKKCLEITNELYRILDKSGVNCMLSLTTNATLPLDDTTFELFDLLDKINVSVDGIEEQHNLQRRPLLDISNSYQKTINNLRIIAEKYYDKLYVKSSIRDEFYTSNNYRIFLESMAAIGVDIDKVMFGCIHPTDLKHSQDKLQSFISVFAAKPVTAPCCKYRLNNVWLVDSSNDLYDLPYKWAQTKLGTLSEDFDSILERRRKLILDTFPCFNDSKCMSCPVLGFCWGQCVNGDPLTKGLPSNYCNQDKLIDRVNQLHTDGNLIEFMRSQSTATMIEQHAS